MIWFLAVTTLASSALHLLMAWRFRQAEVVYKEALAMEVQAATVH